MNDISQKNNLEFGTDVKLLLQSKNQTEIVSYPNQHRN